MIKRSVVRVQFHTNIFVFFGIIGLGDKQLFRQYDKFKWIVFII
jgi:hypothetical protein